MSSYYQGIKLAPGEDGEAHFSTILHILRSHEKYLYPNDYANVALRGQLNLLPMLGQVVPACTQHVVAAQLPSRLRAKPVSPLVRSDP